MNLIPPSMIDPRFEWMQNESKKHAKENGVEHWQWNEIPVAGFIAADRMSDGAKYDLRYAHWLAMRMKFMDDKCLKFFKDYLRTHERHYDAPLAGYNRIFDCMQSYDFSYIEAILECNYDIQGKSELHYTPYWMYDRLDLDTLHKYKYTKLLDDGKTIVPMTEDEKEAEDNKGLVHVSKEEMDDFRKQLHDEIKLLKANTYG